MPHYIWTKVGNSGHSVAPPTHRPYTGCGRGCYRQASLTSSTTFAPKMFWVCHIIISPLACELTYLLTQESAPPQESALPLRNMGRRTNINLTIYVRSYNYGTVNVPAVATADTVKPHHHHASGLPNQL